MAPYTNANGYHSELPVDQLESTNMKRVTQTNERSISGNPSEDFSSENQCLIVTPKLQTVYTLDELLAQLTNENIHAEVYTGEALDLEW